MSKPHLAYSFAIISFIFVAFSAYVSTEECEPPKKVVDFEWNFTRTSGEDIDRLYFPLGQKNDTNLIKILLYGSSLNPDEDLPKLCPRLYFNESDAVISGVNGTSALFKCTPIDGNKGKEDCKYQGKDGNYDHKLYVTLTDKKSFAFVVRCWSNGLKGWTVLSTKKFLHDDVQLHILDHAKSLGFETADSLPLRYKNCTTNN